MPPQFVNYLQPAYDFTTQYVHPTLRKDGSFKNADWDKFAFDYANTQWQNDYNAYQAELAFNREKELINAQNEYNSPANQLSRYIQAGLNPSMIYGQVTPGLQNSVANYQPQKSEAYSSKSIPGTTEKLQRIMSVVSTVGQFFSSIAGIASQFAGVQNQNLQNQILEAQLPAIRMRNNFDQAYYAGRYDYLDFLFKNYSDNGLITADNWNKYFVPALYPEVIRSEGIQAKSDYQNWWNDTIAPLYKSWFEGRTTAQTATGEINKYNQEMLESLPPAVRPIFGMLMQVLVLLSNNR